TNIGSGSPASGQYTAQSDGVYTFNSAQAGDTVTINYFPFSGYALGYSRTAYAAVANYQLGTSPELPNFNFEVQGLYCNDAEQATGEQYTIPQSPTSPVNILIRFSGEFLSDNGVIDQYGDPYTFVSGS